MASYAKFWTDMFNEDWFVGLKAIERGVYMQLILHAKLVGDTGRINAANMQHLCSIIGCDSRTGDKIVTKLLHICVLEKVSSEHGLCFDIHKYKYYQEVRKPSDRKNVAKMSQNCNSIREDKTIPDKITENIPFEEIITDLNEQAKTKFRHTAETTKKLIQARWTEGHRLDDFQYVHKIKVAEWKGAEFAKYLRPATLYSPKFESYLNQKPVKNAGPGHTSSKTDYGEAGEF